MQCPQEGCRIGSRGRRPNHPSLQDPGATRQLRYLATVLYHPARFTHLPTPRFYAFHTTATLFEIFSEGITVCQSLGRFQLALQSELFILDFARLEQTANLRLAFAFLLLVGALFGLTILGEKLLVVAAELLKGDEEVTQDDLEPSQIVNTAEQAIDGLADVVPRMTSVSSQ
jgi:hypothetical protein